jgi:GH25 family lysozyme M1 (1,4-beta-N-acetylmuramidase)
MTVGPMLLPAANPWPAGSREATEWDVIYTRLTDPRQERRMARYVEDQQAAEIGALRLALPAAEHAELLAGLNAAGVLFGPDCSQFQGKPDWYSVRTSGCIIGGYKVSEGMTYTDPSHAYNRGAVPASGLVPLAYHYMSPTSPAPAQADFYCGLVDPHAIHALDVEAAKAAPGLDVNAWVKRYFEHFPHKTLVIYSNHGMWTARSHVAGGVPPGNVITWHAGYRDGAYTSAKGTLPTEWAAAGSLGDSMRQLGFPPAKLWQFTDHATVPGVNGTCDGNAWQGTLDELRALATGDEDVALTQADKDELVQRTAVEVWAHALKSAWDGSTPAAADMLASTQRYAIEGGWAGKRPPGNGAVGTPTFAAQLAQGVGATVAATDTLEASEAAEASVLKGLDLAGLADAITTRVLAGLSGSADAQLVKQAVFDALAAVRIAPQQPQQPTS